MIEGTDDWSEVFEAIRDQAPLNPEAWHTWGFANVEFKLPNGWTVVVFQDAWEWDYVDHVLAPDGRVFNPFPNDCSEIHPLAHWHPKNPRAWGLEHDDAASIERWNETEHAVT